MPRRSILSATERESLLALPDAKDELIRQYTFNETDLSVIRQRRGAANRLAFAIQLFYLGFPGVILGVDASPLAPLLRMVAAQLKVPVLGQYGGADQGIPPDTVEKMKQQLALGKSGSTIHVYADTPHAFFADYRPSYRKEAAEDAWKKMQQWFADRLK